MRYSRFLLLWCAVWFALLPLSAREHKEGFTCCDVNDALMERIRGRSYPEGCTFPIEELVYLTVLHYDGEGLVQQGELMCNRAIADDLLDIFEALYDAHYPIESIRLIDDFDGSDARSMAANNTSCFCYRTVAATGKLSAHSRGMAVDINPLYNPYVRTANGKQHVEPAEGAAYVDRTRTFPYKIERGDLCHRLFIAHGFRWGGGWKSCKDYQHFEK